MNYKNTKEALNQMDKDELRDLIEKMGEDVIDAAIECDVQLENVEEAYSGHFRSDEDFAEDMAEQCGNIPTAGSSQWPLYCIDWTYAARELMYDYSESGGHYFRSF
jgi:antirestriction protein